MQVKQGKINLHLEEDTNGYCHIVDMNVKVYEKSDGNYIEIVAKNLGKTEKVIHIESQNEEYSNYTVDENFIVYPNTTLDEFVQLLNISGSTLTYTETLTVI